MRTLPLLRASRSSAAGGVWCGGAAFAQPRAPREPVRRHAGVAAEQAGLPTALQAVSPTALQAVSPTALQAGSPRALQVGSPTALQAGSPTALQAGSSTALQAGSPTALQAGSPTALQAGSPKELQAGSPTALQAGSPRALQAGSPTALSVNPTRRALREIINTPLSKPGNVNLTSIAEVWVELRAPRFVVHRHSATLRCEHNVDPEALYKVVFYKGGQRIMKYVRERDPPFEIYNFTGAEINLSKLMPTSLTLERLDFPASGPYQCEIALETPLYSKVSNTHDLNVIVRQKHRPRIKIKNTKYSPSDYLEATCQSGPAHPAPHLTWFINNMKVDERLTIPYGTVNVHRHHHGMPLSMTNSSLHYPLTQLQLISNQTVEITCLSTIPSYATLGEDFADVQNHTVNVNVLRLEPAPTQLPVKIISSEFNSSARSQMDPNYIVLLSFATVFARFRRTV